MIDEKAQRINDKHWKTVIFIYLLIYLIIC
jgi:hypothetical protein